MKLYDQSFSVNDVAAANMRQNNVAMASKNKARAKQIIETLEFITIRQDGEHTEYVVQYKDNDKQIIVGCKTRDDALKVVRDIFDWEYLVFSSLAVTTFNETA